MVVIITVTITSPNHEEKLMVDYSNQQHQEALKAARSGTASATQRDQLEAAARQAGGRGKEAAKALRGEK